MFCTNCGQQIDDNSAFCPYCGCHTENGPSELQLPAVSGGFFHQAELEGEEIIQDSVPQGGFQQGGFQQAGFQQQGYQQPPVQAQPDPFQQQAFQPQGGGFQQQTPPYPAGGVYAPVKKPVNKKLFVILGIAAGVIALGVGGFFAFKHFSGGSKGNSYAYVTEDDINFVKNPKSVEPISLERNKGDEINYSQVFYSPGGKYIYFFTKVDYSEYVGTLNRVPKNKVNSKDFSKYIETIGSDIGISYIECMGEESIAYIKDDNLYAYDGKQETKISKDVDYFDVDNDFNYIVYEKEDDDYTYDLYRASVKDLENSEKIDSEVDDFCYSDSYDNFLYYKYDEDDYETAIYAVDKDGNTEKLFDNGYVSSFYNTDTESYTQYILADTGDTIDPYDYVDVDTDDIYYWDDEDEDEYEMTVYDIYIWDKGNLTSIDEGIINYSRGYNNCVIYNKADNLSTADIDEDELYWPSDIIYELDVDYTHDNYVLNLYDNKIYQMTGKVDDLWSDMAEQYSDYKLFSAGSDIYMFDDEDDVLYEVESSDGELSNAVKAVTDCGVAGVSYEAVYVADEYDEDKNGHGFANFYKYSNGNSELLAEEAYSDWVRVYKDGTILAATDVDDSSYEIAIFEKGVATTTIGDEISLLYRLSDGTILYVEDEDLYVYNGKESTKIDSDVLGVYPENTAEIDAYLYYYDYDYEDD